MTYSLFILSLLSLCAASIAAFIMAFKKRSWPLIVFVPLITLCGSFIYISYTSVLGYPVQMEWKDMPSRFTVIYFRVVEKETISLWVIDKKSTRLIELQYNTRAEDGLEGERGTMGQGTPVTFMKKGKGLGQPGEGAQGALGLGNRDGDQEGRRGQRGWKYKVESRGDPIPGNALPPKVQ